MKAIRTKYHGPGNVRGSRFSATSGEQGQKIFMAYDYALNSEKNHAKAARQLADKFNWKSDLIGGGFPDGTMVWVFADSMDRA
jgi:hypothetical protein